MDTRSPPSALQQAIDRFQPGRLGPRERLIVGILAVVGIVLLGWYLVHRNSRPPGPPPAPVRIAIAQRQSLDVVEHTIGTVLAESTVNITAEVSGQLVATAFK